MATATLRKVGGSVMVAIPPTALDELSLTVGSTVSVSIEDGRLAIAPARKRYTLDELLAACDPDAALSDADRMWLDDAPIGKEII